LYHLSTRIAEEFSMTTTAPDWAALAATVSYPTDLLIDGAWVTGATRREVVTPIDGTVVAEVAMAEGAEVDLAVAAARASFEDRRWAGMAPADRKDVLVRWAHLVNEHAEQLAVLTTLEMGKPAREAKAIDVRACHRTLRWFGEAVDKVLDEMPKGRRLVVGHDRAGAGRSGGGHHAVELPADAGDVEDRPRAGPWGARWCSSRRRTPPSPPSTWPSWAWRRACPRACSTS
jgi:hypothetical protein